MIGILKTLLLAALMVLLGPSTGVSQTNVSLGWFPSLFAPTNGYYHAGEPGFRYRDSDLLSPLNASSSMRSRTRSKMDR